MTRFATEVRPLLEKVLGSPRVARARAVPLEARRLRPRRFERKRRTFARLPHEVMSHQRRRPARDVSSNTQRQPSLAQIRKRPVSPGGDRLDERLATGAQRLARRVVVRVAMAHAAAAGARDELDPRSLAQERVHGVERVLAGVRPSTWASQTSRSAARVARTRSSQAASPAAAWARSDASCARPRVVKNAIASSTVEEGAPPGRRRRTTRC